MHRLAPLLILIVAACGGHAASTTPAPSAPAAAMPAYCEGYRTCAAEAPLMEHEASSLDDLAAADRAAVEEAIDANLDHCQTVWDGLTPHQRAWLEACTGCGGSCDVYDCIDQAGQIGDGDEFTCDAGDDGADDDSDDGGE